MQELILLNENEVVVQVKGRVYQESVSNFLADYGKPVDYNAIDYNRTTKGCWLNGHAFQEYPNKVCEDILNSIDNLLAKKAEREYVEPEPPTEEELQQYFEDAIEAYMTRVVQTRNYRDIHTAASYVNSTNEKFAKEGAACNKWRDDVWDKCYAILAEVKAGTRAIPTLEEVIAELPVLVW